MSASTQLEALRAWVHEGPSKEAWNGICAALDAMSDGDAKELGTPYVSEHTQRWWTVQPDGWGRGVRVAPGHWLEPLAHGEDNPRLAVVDTIKSSHKTLPVAGMLKSEALAQAPLRRLEMFLSDASALFRKRGFKKRFSALEEVAIDAQGVSNPDFAAAMKAPGWKAVQRASFWQLHEAWPIHVWSGSNALQNVTHLGLGTSGLDPGDCANWRFAKMRKMVWLNVGQNTSYTRDIARGPMCKTLRYLDALNQDPHGALEDGHFQSDAFAFAYNPNSQSLRALWMTPCEIGIHGMESIANSKHLHESVKAPYKRWLDLPEDERPRHGFPDVSDG